MNLFSKFVRLFRRPTPTPTPASPPRRQRRRNYRADEIPFGLLKTGDTFAIGGITQRQLSTRVASANHYWPRRRYSGVLLNDGTALVQRER